MRLMLLSLLIPLLSCAMEDTESNVQGLVRSAYSELALSLGFNSSSYQFPGQLLTAERLEEKYAQKLSIDFYKVLYRNEIIYLLGQAQAHLKMADQVLSSQINSKLNNIPSEKKVSIPDMKSLCEGLSIERFAFGQAESNFISIKELSRRIRKKAGL